MNKLKSECKPIVGFFHHLETTVKEGTLTSANLNSVISVVNKGNVICLWI